MMRSRQVAQSRGRRGSGTETPVKQVITQVEQ